MDVDTMLKEPKNPEWRKVSVEFCGGTHVETTGLIKDMVIIEESGIAKGIRRITALTGDAAHRVQREAALFGDRLTSLEQLPQGPEKEEQVRVAQQDLNNLVVSTLTKEELRTRYAKILKEVMEDQKKRQKAELKLALSTVQDWFGKPENKDAKAYVGHLGVGANAKAVSEVMNYYKSKDKERSVYVFGGSKDEGVVHGVYVGTVSNCFFC